MASSKLEAFTQYFEERRSRQPIIDKEMVVKKFFGDNPFRSDVLYQGVRAQGEVLKLTNDEMVAVGMEINPYDVGELYKSVGVIIDEQGEVKNAIVISKELYKVMENLHIENPDMKWSDVKRFVYLQTIMKNEKEVYPIVSQSIQNREMNQMQESVVSSSV